MSVVPSSQRLFSLTALSAFVGMSIATFCLEDPYRAIPSKERYRELAAAYLQAEELAPPLSAEEKNKVAIAHPILEKIIDDNQGSISEKQKLFLQACITNPRSVIYTRNSNIDAIIEDMSSILQIAIATDELMQKQPFTKNLPVKDMAPTQGVHLGTEGRYENNSILFLRALHSSLQLYNFALKQKETIPNFITEAQQKQIESSIEKLSPRNFGNLEQLIADMIMYNLQLTELRFNGLLNLADRKPNRAGVQPFYLELGKLSPDEVSEESSRRQESYRNYLAQPGNSFDNVYRNPKKIVLPSYSANNNLLQGF